MIFFLFICMHKILIPRKVVSFMFKLRAVASFSYVYSTTGSYSEKTARFFSVPFQFLMT